MAQGFTARQENRFQPTYEELKLPRLTGGHYPISRFQPTYEELKPGLKLRLPLLGQSFQPTYEELKPGFEWTEDMVLYEFPAYL